MSFFTLLLTMNVFEKYSRVDHLKGIQHKIDHVKAPIWKAACPHWNITV